ncbi:GIP [Symbiodinium sp. CCMP2456]|nr:GIP [Symbiodinium sp. CCMP2456]
MTNDLPFRTTERKRIMCAGSGCTSTAGSSNPRIRRASPAGAALRGPAPQALGGKRLAPLPVATTAGGKGGKGSKKGKPPEKKKKNKRGPGRLKRPPAANSVDRGQGSSSAAAPRRVVLTYTQDQVEEGAQKAQEEIPRSKGADRSKGPGRGVDEACSSCDERVTKYRPLVRRRVLKRFSGPELRKRVEEALTAKEAPEKEASQEEGLGAGLRSTAEAHRGLVDTRQLGKPEKFSGEPAAFEDWSFVLEAYMCFQALFERIRCSDVPVLQASLSPGEAELSTQLFYTLVMLLQGGALDIAQNTDLGNALEVYRKLVSEYRPRLASRFVGTLTQLMSHKFTASLEAEIPFFEKLVRRYEAETGKQLDDTIKLGIIINGLQDESLKQHVVRNSARLKTYQLLKDELLEVARTSRVLAEQPVPMDMSALPKWKQGQGSQGGGQGQGKGKEVVCWYCEKKGHTKEEPEPMLASPTLAEERDYVAAVTLPQEAQGFKGYSG